MDLDITQLFMSYWVGKMFSIAFNGVDFSYRNRKPHLYYLFLLRFVKWVLTAYKYRQQLYAPDWPGTVHKHAGISTTLKK